MRKDSVIAIWPAPQMICLHKSGKGSIYIIYLQYITYGMQDKKYEKYIED